MRVLNVFKNRLKVAAKNLWRGNSAIEIRKARRWDRKSFIEGDLMHHGQPFWWTDSDVARCKDRFGFDYLEIARRLSKRRREPLRFLDLGAGQGLIGMELQNALGIKNVEAHAASLLRPFQRKGKDWEVTGRALARISEKPWERFETFHVGDFRKQLETWYEDGKFDLIVSHSSTAIRPAHVLRIGKKLAPGGEAYLHMDLGIPGAFEKVKNALAGYHIEAEVRRIQRGTRGLRGAVVFVKLKRGRFE